VADGAFVVVRVHGYMVHRVRRHPRRWRDPWPVVWAGGRCTALPAACGPAVVTGVRLVLGEVEVEVVHG